jgi:cytoskeletal protein CcmA (bactofilin family)
MGWRVATWLAQPYWRVCSTMHKAIPMPPASSTPPFDAPPSASSRLGASLRITGTVTADEDLELAAFIDGAVSAPNHCVVVVQGARVTADIVARDLTVHGEVSGRLTATEIADLRATARVRGQVAAPRVVLHEGGRVDGRIDTRAVDAAARVAHYRRRQ